MMKKLSIHKLNTSSVIAFTLLFAAACSDSAVTPPAPPPPARPTGPTWMQGVFEPASNFKDRCEVVRTGVDIQGNPFPDRAGSTLLENFWLRSWTNETYLWNNEVTDQNPANFTNRVDYFEQLKTNEITPSGKPKDDFHFSQPTTEYLERRISTPVASYGISLTASSTRPPRDFRILYTEPNSPAQEVVGGLQNFIRGARILEVDGVDLVNANTDTEIDMLNAGLFPRNAGETHTFVVQDPGASAPRTISVTSVDLADRAVNRTSVVSTTSGSVGYMLLNTFGTDASERQIFDAINNFQAQGVSDLIVDLRYNGGGFLDVSAQLGFMIAGDTATSGKTFERLRFNADAGNRNPVTGSTNNSVPFHSVGLDFSVAQGTPLNSLELPRVFILSTEDTCSASEALINGLRGIDLEVVLIGTRTCGKPFGFYPTDNCGETYFTIQFQGVNDKGFGDFADGFAPTNSIDPEDNFAIKTPGCSVADDINQPLGSVGDPLFDAALQFRENGTCPAPATVTKPSAAALAKAGVDGGLALEIPADRDVSDPSRQLSVPRR